MDSRASCASLLEDDVSEHVYQLNNAYVPQPLPSHDVTINDRLFARFDCWDLAQIIELGFREKAMLTLAQYDSKEEYLRALAANELRHPILPSLRVRWKKAMKAEDSSELTTVVVVVVEAEPISWTESVEIPSDSIEAMHGLLSSTGPPASELWLLRTLKTSHPRHSTTCLPDESLQK